MGFQSHISRSFALGLALSLAGCGGQGAACRKDADCRLGYHCEADSPGAPSPEMKPVKICTDQALPPRP